MKYFTLLVCLVCLISGCFPAAQEQVNVYVPAGQSMEGVGEVTVYQSLRYSGKLEAGELRVHVDENRNTILAFGSDDNAVSLYLNEAARQAFKDNLLKTLLFGSKSEEDVVPIEKQVGIIESSPVPKLSNSIRMTYVHQEFGQPWVCLLNISGYDRDTILNAHIGKPEGKRDLALILTHEGVNKLLSLIEEIVHKGKINQNSSG